MWKPWEQKTNYTVPPKPGKVDEQISMIWEYLFNHLPHRLDRQDRRIHFQDVKVNFVLVLLGLILASLAARLFS